MKKIFTFVKDWQILRTGTRTNFLTIIALTLGLVAIVGLNIFLIYRMTAHQTEELGRMQLEVIGSELQEISVQAEQMTLQVAVDTEKLLSTKPSRDDIEKFFENEQKLQENLSNGECFNVYISDSREAIIPGFDMPADYKAAEKLWYRGAAENPGEVYVTTPYVDQLGHGLCFTVSIMLSDEETVVGLDFNFSALQNLITKMNVGNGRSALIVNKSGIIMGYSDANLIGESVSNKLPEYRNILDKVLESENHESFEVDFNGRTNIIFSSETTGGLYVILGVDTAEFYKDDYNRIMANSAVNILLIIVTIIFYLASMKNRLAAVNALKVKEEFLSKMSRDLRTPVQEILKISNIGTRGGEESPAESAARVHKAAQELSGMLDNLFSFSIIISEKKSDSRIDNQIMLSEVSRSARMKIILVLTAAMLLQLGVSINNNLNWGDTKMGREVDSYDSRMTNWLSEKKSILFMFANVLAAHPEVMDNYPDAVKYLDDIAKNYPDISACYLANPYKEHKVIMNNGWEPPEEFSPETRPWYSDTEKSISGFSISSPYYDVHTGFYCITMAKLVLDSNRQFVGIFCIDFYVDRLIDILAQSYKPDGYAFLVDKNGIIINHPNFAYQMYDDREILAAATEYAAVFSAGKDFIVKDFRGKYVTCSAKKNDESGFTVVVANDWSKIYGQMPVFGGIFIAIYIVGILLVVGLVNSILKWQAIVQRELKKSADTALAAGQAKSQFFAQMSHEIRTPINAIIGMNEMILRESNDEEILEYADNISNASRMLLTLINSILDLSKIEEGKMEIIPVRYDTLNVVDDLVTMIYERAHKKNLSLITKIDPNLPRTLFGDDMRIKQVIMNLLTNAVKYTKQGTVTLSMRGEFLGGDIFMLYVSVEDTGIGIRQEDMARLFESFQRLDEMQNKNIEGTGLGISIVTELLRMMNSRLEVSSVYGAGSNFHFKLPQKIIDRTPINAYDEHHHGERQIRQAETKFITAPNAKILVVDDTNMNLKVIRGLLKRNKIVPDLVESGRQALESATKNFYHIIFLDHMMPEMDGVETLKRLKKMNLPAATKIIVLTANAISGARERYLDLGFDDYLSKPIDIDALERLLAKHLPPEVIGDEKISAPEEIVGEDEFSQAESSRLQKICPAIDLDTGLANCMDSKEFFTEMVGEFVAGDKSAELEKFFAAADWNGYHVSVHALKSTSLVIGAIELSEKAKAQEFAARDGEIDALKENHAALLNDYKKIRENLSAWLNA